MGQTIDELIAKIMSGEDTSARGIERLNYSVKYPVADVLRAAEVVGASKVQGFVIDNDNRFAYENFIKWVLGDPTMLCHNPNGKAGDIQADITKGVYICSRTGRGKTMMTEIMLHICRKLNLGYKYKGLNRILWWTSRRADEIMNEYSNGKDCLKAYVEDCPVLCIQDLGTESTEGAYMGNKVEVMKSILEARADDPRCLTIITSNFPLWQNDVITQKYGSRVLSRLMQLNYIQMAGPDRRIVKAEAV